MSNDRVEIIKKKRKHRSAESESGDNLLEQDDQNIQNMPAPAEEFWSPQHIHILLIKIREQLPKHDKIKFSTSEQKLDWEQTAFEDKTADMCRTMWQNISQKLPHVKSLTNLVDDATHFIKNQSNVLQVNMSCFGVEIKKPLPPWLRFYQSKLDGIKRRHPELGMTDISKVVGRKFKKLSEEKLAAIKTEYDEEMKEYHIKVQQIKDQHAVQTTYRQRNDEGIKVKTAQQFFIDSKFKRMLRENPQAGKKENLPQLREVWVKLSDQKRMRWIRRALAHYEQYKVEAEELKCTDPDFEVKPLSAVLTRKEQDIKDQFDGKPVKPPHTGYNLYCHENSVDTMKAGEQLKQFSQAWKEMDATVKNEFKDRAAQLNIDYDKNIAEYNANLPEEDRIRQQHEEELKMKARSARRVNQNKVSRHMREEPPNSDELLCMPARPISAMFMYITENISEYSCKNPHLMNSTVVNKLAEEYKQLPRSKKIEYTQKEKDEKDTYQQKITQYLKHSGRMREELFSGEPDAPPANALFLFKKEQCLTTSDYVLQWKALDETIKLAYRERLQKLNRQYQRRLIRFKQGLAEEDLAKYEELASAKASVKHPRHLKKQKQVVEVDDSDEERRMDGEDLSSSFDFEDPTHSNGQDEEEHIASSKQAQNKRNMPDEEGSPRRSPKKKKSRTEVTGNENDVIESPRKSPKKTVRFPEPETMNINEESEIQIEAALPSPRKLVTKKLVFSTNAENANSGDDSDHSVFTQSRFLTRSKKGPTNGTSESDLGASKRVESILPFDSILDIASVPSTSKQDGKLSATVSRRRNLFQPSLEPPLMKSKSSPNMSPKSASVPAKKVAPAATTALVEGDEVAASPLRCSFSASSASSSSSSSSSESDSE